jgi:FkbM family methyltransferase
MRDLLGGLKKLWERKIDNHAALRRSYYWAKGLYKRFEYWRAYTRVKVGQGLSTYTEDIFARHIDRDKIDVVFELGSRDCRDAIIVNGYYKPKVVYAFECNPECLKTCAKILKKHRDQTNIHLIKKAVWSENKRIKFYPVVESYFKSQPYIKRKNPAASSCFRESGTYLEKFFQDTTEVDAVRLDNFCDENNINKIDLICMDLQGAEYHALLGLGNKINKVHYIITELEKIPIYDGQHCFDDVNHFLEKHNFKLIDYIAGDTDGNFLFINQALE